MTVTTTKTRDKDNVKALQAGLKARQQTSVQSETLLKLESAINAMEWATIGMTHADKDKNKGLVYLADQIAEHFTELKQGMINNPVTR